MGSAGKKLEIIREVHKKLETERTQAWVIVRPGP